MTNDFATIAAQFNVDQSSLEAMTKFIVSRITPETMPIFEADPDAFIMRGVKAFADASHKFYSAAIEDIKSGNSGNSVFLTELYNKLKN